MDVVYLGHASFRLKGKKKTVVTDPYDERLGKFPRGIEADILTVSHDHSDHNQADKVGGSPFVINGPGEYEVGGVSIVGVATWHDDKQGEERGRNTVYVIEIDGLRVAHAGDLGHRLSQEQLDAIGSVDVLMIPVGGMYTVDAKMAAEVVKQTEPVIVIPMHFQTSETKLANPLMGVEEFLKEMGKPIDMQPVNKYSLALERLPAELQVVVMEKKV